MKESCILRDIYSLRLHHLSRYCNPLTASAFHDDLTPHTSQAFTAASISNLVELRYEEGLSIPLTLIQGHAYVMGGAAFPRFHTSHFTHSSLLLPRDSPYTSSPSTAAPPPSPGACP